MEARDMRFRFIIPQWDDAVASFVPCLEPDTRFASKTLCECEFHCGDSYMLGYVRAEEMLLDHEVLAGKYHLESYLSWACEKICSGDALPSFLDTATEHVDVAERITALALYRMVSQELKCGRGDDGCSRPQCNDAQIADRKLGLYFLLPSLPFEIEDDAYNYGYRVRSQNDSLCDRLNVPYAEFAHTLVRKVKGKVDAENLMRREDAIEVICGNVEDVVADAVVNAANEHLASGSGICGAIFRKAGYAPLQAACDKVAPCPTGEARITPAFGITNARYVIHAVGPRWFGGSHGEPGLLANCYRNLFRVAVENGCKSVAVPSISTGIFGYPLDAAIEIAVREAKSFVAEHPGFKVIFVSWAGGENGGKGTRAKYLKQL